MLGDLRGWTVRQRPLSRCAASHKFLHFLSRLKEAGPLRVATPPQRPPTQQSRDDLRLLRFKYAAADHGTAVSSITCYANLSGSHVLLKINLQSCRRRERKYDCDGHLYRSLM